MTEPIELSALRILAFAAERATEQPLPLRKQNQRKEVLDMAIKLAKETIATVERS